MIYVNSAAMQNEIIKLLEDCDAAIKFKYSTKKGIKLGFEVDTEDLDNAIIVAKAVLKDSELGKALYFQVTK